jgi:hypothetical protein
MAGVDVSIHIKTELNKEASEISLKDLKYGR